MARAMPDFHVSSVPERNADSRKEKIMIQNLRVIVTSFTLLSLIMVGAIWAQTSAPTLGMVEGKVKAVDTSTGTLSIASGLFGIFRTKLAVNQETQVTVDGRDAALLEIPMGAKVTAAYERRNDQLVATRVTVTSATQTRAGTSQKAKAAMTLLQ
jgi:hypothetical protein